MVSDKSRTKMEQKKIKDKPFLSADLFFEAAAAAAVCWDLILSSSNSASLRPNSSLRLRFAVLAVFADAYPVYMKKIQKYEKKEKTHLQNMY